jgi:hypothetical protein
MSSPNPSSDPAQMTAEAIAADPQTALDAIAERDMQIRRLLARVPPIVVPPYAEVIFDMRIDPPTVIDAVSGSWGAVFAANGNTGQDRFLASGEWRIVTGSPFTEDQWQKILDRTATLVDGVVT